MLLTVLGGCGAWPGAGQACSGYLVEHDGFRLLVDFRLFEARVRRDDAVVAARSAMMQSSTGSAKRLSGA